MSTEANGTRRQFSSQDKVRIIKQHLIEKVPVSDLCDKHGILPTQLYQWQKEFFARAAAGSYALSAPKAVSDGLVTTWLSKP